MGDSNSVKGILRGGWRKRRFDVSSKGVEREEHAAQKTPPHLRQCYTISNYMRKVVKKRVKCRPTCRRSKNENCTRQYKLSQVEEEESGCYERMNIN